MAHGWESIDQLPPKYRAAAQAQLDAVQERRARRYSLPPREPARPAPPLLTPYTTTEPAVHDFIPGQVTLVLPGRVPLVNQVNDAHWRGRHEVRDQYRTTVMTLLMVCRPRPMDPEAEYDLVTHHLVAERPGPLPDADAIAVAMKGACDGLTSGDHALLPHDRYINHVMTIPRRGTVDVLYLTLRQSTGWPWPVITNGANTR